MKKALAIILTLAMVIALCACGGSPAPSQAPAASEAPAEAPSEAPSEQPADEPEAAADFYTDDISVDGISVEGKKIVYIAPSLDIEYWQWVEDGVRQACEEYGVSIEVYVSNNSAADQAENGETAVIQGFDAVVLSPVSSDSCSTVLDAMRTRVSP